MITWKIQPDFFKFIISTWRKREGGRMVADEIILVGKENMNMQVLPKKIGIASTDEYISLWPYLKLGKTLRLLLDMGLVATANLPHIYYHWNSAEGRILRFRTANFISMSYEFKQNKDL